ncbi:MAG TPA: STAS/SEC14 domain-containing protein [Sulfuriferula sp.]|nr:STAS/SEC14 domain-containing protein [Sulfuriferula sp.]
MINISIDGNTVRAAVLGEFTLADYREFEQNILYGVKFEGKVNLLLDLRDMLKFTLDVAWEEISFGRAHAADFARVAVVAQSQWIIWSAWITRMFVDAQIQVFEGLDAAENWLAA